jgi:hypothetical protein
LIPRNYGEAPGNFTVNLRVAKNFGFGQSAQAKLAASQKGQTAQTGATQNRQFQGGPGGPQGGHEGGRGPGGPMPPGAMIMMGGGGGSDHPYNLTISVTASNIFNRVNAGPPVGNLSSPLFGQSTGLASGGIVFGGGGGSAANNRRMDLQMSFRF